MKWGGEVSPSAMQLFVGGDNAVAVDPPAVTFDGELENASDFVPALALINIYKIIILSLVSISYIIPPPHPPPHNNESYYDVLTT